MRNVYKSTINMHETRTSLKSRITKTVNKSIRFTCFFIRMIFCEYFQVFGHIDIYQFSI